MKITFDGRIPCQTAQVVAAQVVLFRSILQYGPLNIAADVAANVDHYSGRKILVDEQDLLENVCQHHITMSIEVADRYAPRSARALGNKSIKAR